LLLLLSLSWIVWNQRICCCQKIHVTVRCCCWACLELCSIDCNTAASAARSMSWDYWFNCQLCQLQLLLLLRLSADWLLQLRIVSHHIICWDIVMNSWVQQADCGGFEFPSRIVYCSSVRQQQEFESHNYQQTFEFFLFFCLIQQKFGNPCLTCFV
jgi:hypothetical protein